MQRAGKSGVRCLPCSSSIGRLIAVPPDGREIAAQCFERIFLGVNLTARSNSLATKKRNRRTPALDRMLKKKWQNDARNGEEFPVHEQAQNRTRESQRGCICLQPSFDIPLFVEFIDPS